MKHLSAFLFMGVLAAPAARAQETPPPLGASHRVVVSLERVVGFAHGSSSETMTDPSGVGVATLEKSGTVAGLLGEPGSTPAHHMVPRIAADVLLLRGLTVGGALSYARSSQERHYVWESNGSSRLITMTSGVFLVSTP